MVKKVILNLDSTKASGPDVIPVVVLKNYGPERSYILAALFDMDMKESCFPGWWLSEVTVFRILGKSLLLKTTTLLVFFL